mmetsp:Transcript_77594/g.222267  ORF Transcript_77594/g.222267 Transcript_77594/m.222267 type:complete len:213 (+) Transcript_77594:1285-1923(+)
MMEPKSDTQTIIGFSFMTLATISTIMMVKGMNCLKQQKTHAKDSAPTMMQIKPKKTMPKAIKATPHAIIMKGPNKSEVHTTQQGALLARAAKHKEASSDAPAPAPPAPMMVQTSGNLTSEAPASFATSLPMLGAKCTAAPTTATHTTTKGKIQKTSLQRRAAGKAGHCSASAAPLWISSTFLSARATGRPCSNGMPSTLAVFGSVRYGRPGT